MKRTANVKVFYDADPPLQVPISTGLTVGVSRRYGVNILFLQSTHFPNSRLCFLHWVQVGKTVIPRPLGRPIRISHKGQPERVRGLNDGDYLSFNEAALARNTPTIETIEYFRGNCPILVAANRYNCAPTSARSVSPDERRRPVSAPPLISAGRAIAWR